MQQRGNSTVVEALSAWGAHEAQGRLSAMLRTPVNGTTDSLELVLNLRGLMVGHLLSKEPQGCVLIELEPADIPAITLSNGQTIDAWCTQARNTGGPSWHHVARLVQAATPPEGPVLVAGHILSTDTTTAQARVGALTLYDGWHRAAAWYERCRQGLPSNLMAHLVLTKS